MKLADASVLVHDVVEVPSHDTPYTLILTFVTLTLDGVAAFQFDVACVLILTVALPAVLPLVMVTVFPLTEAVHMLVLLDVAVTLPASLVDFVTVIVAVVLDGDKDALLVLRLTVGVAFAILHVPLGVVAY